MGKWESLMHPDTQIPIKCPLLKGDACVNHCGWFDPANRQCAIVTIGSALSQMAPQARSEEAATAI